LEKASYIPYYTLAPYILVTTYTCLNAKRKSELALFYKIERETFKMLYKGFQKMKGEGISNSLLILKFTPGLLHVTQRDALHYIVVDYSTSNMFPSKLKAHTHKEASERSGL
jgi:hypothetical protein